MNRRTFLVSAGLATAPIAARPAAAEPTVDLYPGDVEIGDVEQSLAIAVAGIDGDRLTVRVDLSALESASIDLDAAAVDEERSNLHHAELVDATIEDVELLAVFELDEDALRGTIVVGGLETDGADDRSASTYDVTVTANDDLVYEGESDPFDVVDPDERELKLSLRPGRLERDAREQQLRLGVEGAPADALVVAVNVGELSTIGVGTDELGVVDPVGEGATVETVELRERDGEPIVRFVVDPDAERFDVGVTLTGLDATDAESGREIGYYATIEAGGDPEIPTAENHDVRGTVTLIDSPDADDEYDEPQPEPDPDPGPTEENATDPADQPGFGVLAAVGGAIVAVLARQRAKSG